MALMAPCVRIGRAGRDWGLGCGPCVIVVISARTDGRVRAAISDWVTDQYQTAPRQTGSSPR